MEGKAVNVATVPLQIVELPVVIDTAGTVLVFTNMYAASVLVFVPFALVAVNETE